MKTITPRRIRLACAVLMTLIALPAQAQEAIAAPPDPALSVRLRAMLPVTSFMNINAGGTGSQIGVGVAGLSFGAELWHLWAVEAGAGAWFTSIYGLDTDLFVRSGVAPRIADWRGPDGHGWTLQCDALAGFRQQSRFLSPDGHDGTEETEGVTGNVGFEWARFSSSRGALVLRLLTGVTVPVTQTRTGYWASHNYIDPAADLRYLVDLTFTVGVAF